MTDMADARRYGKAFLNFFYEGDAASLPLTAYYCWRDFLATHHALALCLSMSSVSTPVKHEVIQRVVHACRLGTPEMTLMQMLCRRRNANLLEKIVTYLCKEALQMRNEEEWTITSAHQLTQHAQEALVTALANATGQTILPHFCVDASVYAGFRLRSETLYWERSFAQVLHRIDQCLRK